MSWSKLHLSSLILKMIFEILVKHDSVRVLRDPRILWFETTQQIQILVGEIIQMPGNFLTKVGESQGFFEKEV